MKKLFFIFLCLLSSAAFVPAQAADESESVYAQILSTGKIRCAYGVGAPLVMKDPNTGEISGIMPDIMAEIGKVLSLDVEWTNEVGWGDLAVTLQSRKADLICSTIWASGARGRQMAFSRPLFFSKIDAYARTDDERFQTDPAAIRQIINQPDIRISTRDNDVSEEIATTNFPKARTIPLAQMMGEEFMLVDIVMNKADLAFLYASYAESYEKKNPGKIRRLPLERPLRLYDNVLAMSIDEYELQNMINAALSELINSGKIDRILDHYEQDYPGMLLRLAKPYRPQ